MVTTTNNHSADASQPSEFELRRAALVSEIGEVRFYVLRPCQTIITAVPLVVGSWGSLYSSVERKTCTDSFRQKVVSGTSPHTCQCIEPKSGRHHRGTCVSSYLPLIP
jgi:hypothetical protein